ncbi:MAG: MFS transporter, partial [Bacteroidota bacterium]
NRTRSYSLNRLAINMGWAVGSAIGGLIAKYNYELLFWVDGITNIGAAILMLAFVKPVDYKPAPHKKTVISAKESALHDSVYMWFIVLAALFAACFFQLFTNLSVHYKLNLHFSEPFIGLLMATNGLIIVVIEMVIVYKLEGRKKNTVYIIMGTLLMAVAYCMLNAFIITAFMAFVMIIVITFAEMLAMPFMNSYWIGRSKPHNRGQYAALYTMAWSAAQTFGPMSGAQVAEHWGFNRLWWIVCGLTLVAAIGFMQLQVYTAKKEPVVIKQSDLNTNAELLAASEEPLL